VLVGVELVGDVEVGIAEKIEVGTERLVRLQRLQDCLRRVPLVDEQREGGYCDLLPFGFATPGEERLGQTAKAGDALGQRRVPLSLRHMSLRSSPATRAVSRFRLSRQEQSAPGRNDLFASDQACFAYSDL
jgi:hypothetical protein